MGGLGSPILEWYSSLLFYPKGAFSRMGNVSLVPRMRNMWLLDLLLKKGLAPLCFCHKCCLWCSVTKSCSALCDPMDCSTPGVPVLHYLPEFAQTHVHLGKVPKVWLFTLFLLFFPVLKCEWASLVAQLVKNLPQCGRLGLGRFPGGEHGNPLQYSCLENPMDKGAWQATVHGVAKSRTSGRLGVNI